MKTAIASLPLLVLPAGAALSTKYEPERAVRMEIETEIKLETTTMEIERDGERVESPGGGSTHLQRKEVHVDRALEVADGKPTKVRRTFESLSGKSQTVFGESTRDSETESPLEGVTLEITRDGDDFEAAAVEGGSPDSKALEGHRGDLFLDALLPEKEVAVDETWELDTDTVKRALRLDLNNALFPPPERTEGGGEEGGGRRRGMRGGADAGLLSRAEWKGTAKLVATDRDVDGTTCAEIAIELEAAGDLPEPERGGGRGERMAGTAAVPVENTYRIELEGSFLFAVKERRPHSIELDGTARVERRNEMTRGESTMRFHVVQEGTVTFKVQVAESPASDGK